MLFGITWAQNHKFMRKFTDLGMDHAYEMNDLSNGILDLEYNE